MPSTNNGNGTRYKTALDTELGKKVVELERDFYRYVDVAMPKKHRYTLVMHCEQRLTDARDLIVEGMDYEIDIYPSEKRQLLAKARAALRNVEIDLQQLNDLGDVSNEAKAHFDDLMDLTQTHLARLLRSLSSRLDIMSESRKGTPMRDACGS